ncbi:MAG: hypothetical protein P8N76_28090 [Pirellulaceae bacterium]|nr:hypothetical protein [Pirellulaceae bacterium]
MESLTSHEANSASEPPKLWRAHEFGVFRDEFNVEEQHQLLRDDSEARRQSR